MENKKECTPFLKQWFVTAAVGINIVGHGCVLGFPGILLPQLAMKHSAIKLSPRAASWIASIMGITQIIGSFVSPPIMERYGRKVAHLAVIALNWISWLITTTAYNFEMLFAARLIQGLSIGMLSPLRSVLIGEYSSPKNRGAFLMTVSLTQTFGIFLVHLIGSVISWQITALICVVFPFISIIMTIYSPESPSWLLKRDRYEECKKVFRWLRGNEDEAELHEMISSQSHYKNSRTLKNSSEHLNFFQNMWRTIKKPEFYKPIILMMHAHVLVNFAGGPTMCAYSIQIIETLMGPEANAQFWMIFLDGQRFVFNTIAVFVINRFSRRTIMFSTGVLSISCHLAIAVYLYFVKQGSFPYDSMWIPIILINLKIFALAVGVFPVPNVIGGEVLPLQYRSVGGSISLVSFSATYFLVLKTFVSLVGSIGMYGVYLLYAGILTYCMIVIWILLPETKDRTLQQIEDEFRGKSLVPEDLLIQSSLYEGQTIVLIHNRSITDK